MTDTKTGRPPKYSEAQVLMGVGLVEQRGATPTGDAVKKVMCAELGVSVGINAQSLDAEVQRLLEERNRQRGERLVAALPASTRSAATEIGARLGAMVLEHLAAEHDGLRALTGKRIVELTEDLGAQRAQIRGLLTQVGEKDGALAELEAQKHGLEERLATATTEVAALKELISGMEKQDDLRAQILVMMKETLLQHQRSAA
jgi:chromosome segregation ATPase